MNNTELSTRLLVCLLIFMLAGSFIIGTGLSMIDGDGIDEDNAIPAAAEITGTDATFCIDGEVYDPVENAENQLILARQTEERGCIVVLAGNAEAGESTKTLPDAESGETAPENIYYSLSLSDEQQDKIYALCVEFDLPAELAFGIISADSQRSELPSYEAAPHSILHPNIDSAAWYMEHYSLTDMNDFDQNARLGIIMLSEYYHRYPDVNKIAMCYELGEAAALELWSGGTVETEYSALVALSINMLVPRAHSPS